MDISGGAVIIAAAVPGEFRDLAEVGLPQHTRGTRSHRALRIAKTC